MIGYFSLTLDCYFNPTLIALNMSKIYSPEELNSFSKETLVAVILPMQDQLSQLNANMERLIEQIADANNKRYGRFSDELRITNK